MPASSAVCPWTRFERERDAIRADIERAGFNAALGQLHAAAGRRHRRREPAAARPLRLHRAGGRAHARHVPGDHGPPAARRPGLIYRDETSLPQAEGAFGICSAWVDRAPGAAAAASLAEAEGWFRQFLGYGNDLGLFAEEIDPATGAALGNFPQAYSHVGLIGAALAIEARRRADAADAAPRTRGRSRRGSERADMNWASWLLWGFAATAVLTTLMAGSEGLGLTRMNIPHMLGTMFTPNRDRAKVYGASCTS